MPDIHKEEKRKPKRICLKEICLQAVRENFTTLGSEAIVDLPVPLIKDLLPHLTVCQLDELQPTLNKKGISTYSGWVRVLLDMCGPNHVIDLRTEEEAKHKVMKMLFTAVFYGFTNSFIKQNITNLNTPSFLWAAANCVRKFSLLNLAKPLQALTAEKRPFLNFLEKCIKSVCVSQYIDLLKRESQTPLYILHRLLDHGVAEDLVIHVQCPIILAWLLHGRGSQYVNSELKDIIYGKKASRSLQNVSASEDGVSCSPVPKTRTSEDQEDQVTPCKRPKLQSVSTEEEELGNVTFPVDPQNLCQMFTPCDNTSASVCPWGKIKCLEISQCGSDCLRVLNASLPTFFCLHSLTLQSFSTFRDSDVMNLARALRQLFDSSCSSLTDLSISVLSHPELTEILLCAIPSLTSLYVEIETMMCGSHLPPHRYETSDLSELPLKNLTVKVAGLQTNLQFIASVLRRSPHLTSLHVAGIRLPMFSTQSQLLTIISESNHTLRNLTLEDMNLADCLPQILNLLRNCKLEDLRLNDCRLLEKCSHKEESLAQLVAALKMVPSLQTLSLAQNRLAKNICVLVELFTGYSPSSVKRLNISSNFIKPADLLEFAKRLQMHRPQHPLTLDLRKNPGDRDPGIWNAAMEDLSPFCHLLVEGWISTNTMADHISNM